MGVQYQGFKSIGMGWLLRSEPLLVNKQFFIYTYSYSSPDALVWCFMLLKVAL